MIMLELFFYLLDENEYLFLCLEQKKTPNIYNWCQDQAKAL